MKVWEMYTDTWLIPNEPGPGTTVCLSRKISAVKLVPDERGVAKLGLFSQLPAGTTIEICGDGFSEQTVKVRCNGQYYFAFRQDVQSPKAFTAKAGGD
jgi:hypothetical protein